MDLLPLRPRRRSAIHAAPARRFSTHEENIMADSPYILINTFRPKNGCFAEFIATQQQETRALAQAAAASGWLGNEIFAAEDESQVVIVTRFASEHAKAQWAQTAAFKAHLEKISPL
ncbi:hypothetical protein CO614_04785 [Lysobacteraceae bacterium NML120232]|nr:hypothetical protein CO614_04785 [Xanthomonadaceae bacterium NML120232]